LKRLSTSANTRWKAFFFLDPNADSSCKETFGFSSRKSPPQVYVMPNFEKRLLGMMDNTKFRKMKCEFQKKLFAATKKKKESEI